MKNIPYSNGKTTESLWFMDSSGQWGIQWKQKVWWRSTHAFVDKLLITSKLCVGEGTPPFEGQLCVRHNVPQSELEVMGNWIQWRVRCRLTIVAHTLYCSCEQAWFSGLKSKANDWLRGQVHGSRHKGKVASSQSAREQGEMVVIWFGIQLDLQDISVMCPCDSMDNEF